MERREGKGQSRGVGRSADCGEGAQGVGGSAREVAWSGSRVIKGPSKNLGGGQVGNSTAPGLGQVASFS